MRAGIATDRMIILSASLGQIRGEKGSNSWQGALIIAESHGFEAGECVNCRIASRYPSWSHTDSRSIR